MTRRVLHRSLDIWFCWHDCQRRLANFGYHGIVAQVSYRYIKQFKNNPHDGIGVTNIDNFSFHHLFFCSPNNDLKIFISRTNNRHLPRMVSSQKLVWKVFEIQLWENKAVFLDDYFKSKLCVTANPVAKNMSLLCL